MAAGRCAALGASLPGFADVHSYRDIPRQRITVEDGLTQAAVNTIKGTARSMGVDVVG